MTVVHSLHLANSFWPHGLQHPRLACSSLSLGVCSNSCQLSQWCYLTISSSAISFLFCPQSFSVSRSFPVNRLVALGSQSIGASALAVLSNVHSGLISFRMDWLDLLAVQGTLKSLLHHHSSKALILWCSSFFMVQLSHLYVTPGNIIALTIQTFVGQMVSLLFNAGLFFLNVG